MLTAPTQDSCKILQDLGLVLDSQGWIVGSWLLGLGSEGNERQLMAHRKMLLVLFSYFVAAGSLDSIPYRGDCKVMSQSLKSNINSQESSSSPSCTGNHPSNHSRSQSQAPYHPCIPDQHLCHVKTPISREGVEIAQNDFNFSTRDLLKLTDRSTLRIMIDKNGK